MTQKDSHESDVAQDSHSDHGAHAAPLPEPESPAWLPIAGVLLFLVVGAWLFWPSPGAKDAATTAGSTVPSASALAAPSGTAAH